jgi:hypothetical protein
MLRVHAGGGAGAQTLIHGYSLRVTQFKQATVQNGSIIIISAACLQTYSVGKAQAR